MHIPRCMCPCMCIPRQPSKHQQRAPPIYTAKRSKARLTTRAAAADASRHSPHEYAGEGGVVWLVRKCSTFDPAPHPRTAPRVLYLFLLCAHGRVCVCLYLFLSVFSRAFLIPLHPSVARPFFLRLRPGHCMKLAVRLFQ